MNLDKYVNNIDYANIIKTAFIKNNETIIYTTVTGPTYFIDFDNKILILMMCNYVHNSKINRIERRKTNANIRNNIYEDILHS